MKRYLLLLFSFVLIFKNADSQKDWECMINFENPSCWGDTLWIDTSTNHNNVWQIGQPNKVTFQNSLSAPNAIVTKLDSFYPVNDTSSFIIAHQATDCLGDIMGVMWITAYYKVNSDTLSDYGTIEFSPDNGVTWINLLTDTFYASLNLYQWSNQKPDFSGNSGNWKWFNVEITDPSHYFNISIGDTVLWRFTFISDSIQTNKDGWMLDDIDVNDWFEDIPIVNRDDLKLSVFPNPCYSVINICTNMKSDIEIYDMTGQIVSKLNNIDKETTIDIKNISQGIYIIKAITKEGIAIKRFIKE